MDLGPDLSTTMELDNLDTCTGRSFSLTILVLDKSSSTKCLEYINLEANTLSLLESSCRKFIICKIAFTVAYTLTYIKPIKGRTGLECWRSKS